VQGFDLAALPTDIIALLALSILVWGTINIRTKIIETHNQVKNDHPEDPNLRHTIDHIVSKVDDIHSDVSDLHGRLSVEEKRSIAADAELKGRMDGLLATDSKPDKK
jgi:hypothetical protein